MKSSVVLRQREGSVLAIVAVMMVALLAIVALAVDLGMAYTARAEAQRVADAAALAGASAYLDFADPDAAVGEVNARAYDYVARNVVRNEHVDPDQDVNVEIFPAQERVRVWVQRRNLGTWFARFLGIDQMTVSASAVAQAQSAGGSKCLKPWALMDIWAENSTDQGDDRWWSEGETWEFDPDTDVYIPTQTIGDSSATGYGSSYRNGFEVDGKAYVNDWGRQLHIKAPDPNSTYVPNPGVFLPWRVGSDDSGAADYRDNIARCNPETIFLGEPYPIETGNMVGPTFQGVNDLIDQDPDAEWNPNFDPDDPSTAVINSVYEDNWMESKRVIKVGMIDPEQIVGSGMQDIVFNNFALLFIEEQSGMHDDVTARFLYFVDGSGAAVGTTTSPLVKIIRLIE